MSDPRLALARDLACADEACAEELRDLGELAHQTAAVRRQAEALSALLASAPAEQARLAAAVAAADREVGACREAFLQAEQDLAAVELQDDRERLAAARRTHLRASDALAAAERRARSARLEADTLAARVEAAGHEVAELEARAAALAASLRERQGVASGAGREPGSGLAAVSEWAAGARAALLVAQGSVAAERDRVIRQLSELSSSILGEPTPVAGAAEVARRIEKALDPG